ncbi:unnamed protein product [Mytilus edulis]|uniref:Mitochondria-eating protein C-terminal domain-containing protein n=1 Tax=Mytilus edulis TaxID=6550 RepID=A0A8S3U5P7_MYTED|nr:unnamed protein product [Mytilus edulis]
MMKEHGIQKEKGFVEQLTGMAQLTNELTYDINQKQLEIKKMNKLSYDPQFKAKQIFKLKVKASDAWKEKQKLYDTIEKQQKNTIKKSSTLIRKRKYKISNSRKDELQTRLSSIAGEKLSKGNPTITDLGDPNRPMKISDKYGELYDNEWTDAMESINDIKSFYSVSEHIDIEEVIVLHLCRLLKICYNECLSLADEQIDNIGKTISETLCLNVNSRSDFYNLPACKDVVVQRRQKSDHFVKHLLANKIIGKTAMHDWEYVNKNGDVMEYLMKTPFFDQCVNLCWCMVIQDPVMYLDGDITQGTTFDKNTYKEFVKSGNKVKYVVWPALFLHKDGPLLHKGTVQAYWDLN